MSGKLYTLPGSKVRKNLSTFCAYFHFELLYCFADIYFAFLCCLFELFNLFAKFSNGFFKIQIVHKSKLRMICEYKNYHISLLPAIFRVSQIRTFVEIWFVSPMP